MRSIAANFFTRWQHEFPSNGLPPPDTLPWHGKRSFLPFDLERLWNLLKN